MTTWFGRAARGFFGRIFVRFAAAGALAVCGTAFAAPDDPALPSSAIKAGSALVMDSETGRVLFARNETAVLPIASLTKLMTAMVVLDAQLDLDEPVTITEDDQSKVKFSRSRLAIGSVVTRSDLLRLALMSSDNRAAAALARSFPGGTPAAIAAMNAKARLLGLEHTAFEEPTGLSSQNVSSATDLARLTVAARDYPVIREYSTTPAWDVQTSRGRVTFGNTNGLVRKDSWDIDLQKTGFISEAGRCLVLSVRMAARPLTIVLLDAAGRYTHFADAIRIRHLIEPGYEPPVEAAPRVVRASARGGRVSATYKAPPARAVSGKAVASRAATPTRVIAPRAATPVKSVAHQRAARASR